MVALLGSVLALVGAIWIAVIAFQNEDAGWGIAIDGVQHFDEAKLPLGLLVIGIIVGDVGRVMMAQAG